MKKTIVSIVSVVLIILTILLSKFYEYKEQYQQIKAFNIKYEKYTNKEIKGTDIATLINQAVDDNEQNGIKKNEKGNYI